MLHKTWNSKRDNIYKEYLTFVRFVTNSPRQRSVYILPAILETENSGFQLLNH